jgi:hypothetical protein
MIVEWVRIYRGRVWHIQAVPDGWSGELMRSALCGESDEWLERSSNLPPAGGLVCRRCGIAVAGLVEAVRIAVDRQNQPPIPDANSVQRSANTLD